MKLRKKSVAAVLAVTMALFCIIGGTLAWLTAETGQVQNVFTVGDINLTLGESSTDATVTDPVTANTYKMVPGTVLAKDPKVTVEAGSEACWLFVKVEESIKNGLNFDNYLDYGIATDWKPLSGHDGVYYCEVAADETNDQEFYVLAGDPAHQSGIVTVKDSVTKADMDALDDPSKYPKLTFTAYAVQKDNIATAEEAWEKLPDDATGADTETD